MWTRGWRDEVWSRLNDPWDLVVVGGGITGAGIASEAARTGIRVLLVEAKDFSSGTSSRSTKLVHGGLRYLRQGQIGVTRESVVERERLMKEAHGLVEPLGFWLTTFQGDKMPGWMFGLGLAVYDVLAGKWAHSKADAKQIVEKVPSLEGAGIRGGYHYFDAQTDDSRLVLRVLRTAVRRGAVALNYARATEVLKNNDGRVCGVVLEDQSGETTRSIEVKAKVVISATGAFADGLRERLGKTRKLRPIRGSHIILPRERLPLNQAVSMLHPKDGRACFALPWEGTTLVGTTDVDHKDDMWKEPRISTDEHSYILESLRHAFPSADIGEKDVRSSFSGVRGVIDTGASDPSKESREHALWLEDGLLTITGGKLTTFRVMAEEALHAVRAELPQRAKAKRGRILEETVQEKFDGVDPALLERLYGRHGEDTRAVLSAPEKTEAISDTAVLWSELRHAAKDEAVVHLEDLLLRRARLGLLAENGGLNDIARIRAVAQPELGWDDARWTNEEASYRSLWEKSYSPKPMG